jgi:hypothetical protein
MNQPGDGDMPRLELTYNFGVDSYDIGTGYGHIAITTDDLDGMLARLAAQGIEPERPPYSVREGGSRLCFVRRSRRVVLVGNPSGGSAPQLHDAERGLISPQHGLPFFSSLGTIHSEAGQTVQQTTVGRQ